MTAQENLEAHQEELLAEMERIQGLILKSETGRKLQDASAEMTKTGIMQQLIDNIGNTENEKEKILIMGYLGEILKRDPANGLKIFSDYLKTAANDPQYASRVDYYIAASNSATLLADTLEYKKFIVANKNFEDDDDPDTVIARDASLAIQEKIKQLAVTK